MAGAFRPRVLYRLAGIATGALVTIAIAPNLQNSPVLLVLCLAIWIGLCIYLAVLDRTPRAFLFQMAAFSSAVICFPYLDDPSNIFTTTISRVEEMTVAILCVTTAHWIFPPVDIRSVIHQRALSFLNDACHWTGEAFGVQHTRLEYEHRRKLAADVTELGMMAMNLRSEHRFAHAARSAVKTDNYLVRSCCLTKECYPMDCCRFRFVSSFLSWVFRARSARPSRLSMLLQFTFSQRFGALAHASQNHFSHTLSAPCVDPAMQRS
jgi:hypothetical protein